MLETIHLTKIYKTKGGVETKALDDVSIRFPETGMVFLLGKSGSGKSTLLNVCGGLDSPTAGEVIVKGRSSKNFSQSDFDSYRNTFIGFVFQEYNILNEFTVEDNIALALELQGKPKDKKAIKQLLDDVDLGAYAHRKPNTLSGGQKQRIAIARALIKQPQIIMADEPTGALDSNTGKQVFDTLKKLSATKLVLVVSHDRDFAEQYADRIIELKDGKILSDVTKEAAQPQSIGENLSVIGDNTLSVKNAAAMTDDEFAYIRTFLSTHENVMLTSGEKEISEFKRANRITDEGGKEYFRETETEKLPKKNYNPKDTKFIRSKLPLRHAFKIGVSGLKSKPIRLIFTILLCTISFIMFGLSSTLMLYDENETLYQTLNDSGTNVVHVDKRYRTTTITTYEEGDSYTSEDYYHTRMTDSEVQKIANKFGSEAFGVTALIASRYDSIYTYNTYAPTATTIDNVSFSEESGKYWSQALLYGGYLPTSHTFRANRARLGLYPEKDNEIWISSYTASVLVEAKYDGATDTQALLNKEISFIVGGDTQKFTVSGIFDSGDAALAQKYGKYKEKTNPRTEKESEEETDEINLLGQELADGYHKIVFFTEKKAAEIRSSTSGSSNSFLKQMENAFEVALNHTTYSRVSALPGSVLSSAGATAWQTGKTSLSDGEVVLSLGALSYATNPGYMDITPLQKELAKDTTIDLDRYLSDWLYGYEPDSSESADVLSAYQKYLELTGEGGAYHDFALKFQFSGEQFTTPYTGSYTGDITGYIECVRYGSYYNDMGEAVALTDEDKQNILTYLLDKMAAALGGKYTVDLQVVAYQKNSEGYTELGPVASTNRTAAIVGISLNSYSYLCASEADYAAMQKDYQDNNYSYYTNTITTKYTIPDDAKYDSVFMPYTSTNRRDLSMFAYAYGKDDSRLAIGNCVVSSLSVVNGIVEELSTVFLWIGVVLAAFSMLLLSTFIASSIAYKKKEIGILRAVGARGADVYKIFFSEAFVIAAICFVLGSIGSVIGCNIINNEISSAITASIFVFGVKSVLILIGIALITSAVATFLPVFSAARKKPVDSIRAL